MRKRTFITYDEMDVEKIIKNQLEKAKSSWLDEFTKVVAKFKDDVMTVLDKVMGELKTIREEQTLMSGRLSEHTDTLEDHDARLEKLEKNVGFSTT